MNTKIKNINNFIDSHDEFYYNGPKYLYKYRPFDEYTFEMIEKNYFYLCPAEKLDDETECVTSVDLEKFYDIENDKLKEDIIDLILNIIKPHVNVKEYKKISSTIYKNILSEHNNYSDFISRLLHEIQLLAPKAKLDKLKDVLLNMPEYLGEKTKSIEELINNGINAKKMIGVCSLSESHKINYMWEKYADNNSGYCIKYEIENYKVNSILPVVYDNKRQTDVIIQFSFFIMNDLIQEASNNMILTDKSHYLKMFLSKYKEWEYQKEWRAIGKAGDKIEAPKIKTIYLGKNVSEKNKQAIIELSKKYKFKVL